MTADGLLTAARARLSRVSPRCALTEQTSGAVLVDVRPVWQRLRDGEVPGSLVVERNHLEWRLDPSSGARVPEATGHDVRVIVLCEAGYTSSLAAAALKDLGLWQATDVIGGVLAWAADGLPLVPGGTPVTGTPAYARVAR